MKGIISLYLDTYGVRDDETIRSRLNSLLKKLHNENSIYRYFPFDYLPQSEQLAYLHYHLEEIQSERQIIANFNKIDANRDYSAFIYRSPNINELPLFDNNTEFNDRIYIESRKVIRDCISISKEDLIPLLKKYNNLMFRQLTCVYYQHELPIVGTSCIGFYVDYINMVILQLLEYRAMYWPYFIFSDIKKDLTYSLENIENLINTKLKEKHEYWKSNPSLTAQNVSHVFANYVNHRSILHEEIIASDTIKAESENNPDVFGAVPNNCQAPKNKIITEGELAQYEFIITEGKKINDFNLKIHNAQKVMQFMHKFALRSCNPWSLQDLKVYFREIYLSKQIYRRNQAFSIVKDYIRQIESNNSELHVSDEAQYLFFNTKISRGYYREIGKLPEYLDVLDFKKSIYDITLKPYLLFDTDESLEMLYLINDILLSVYENYFC